ncbi:restriction endonuclease subunit S [Campylobacter jejuni]|uniref:restriction endonuclease subunit S n=1 Tax=Campylobacter jejuni TaxID=197 RepID=UPI001C8CEF3B|nr:restriction endonuclease subunit S [Campylobacter jejuni]HDV8169412.1 restriction endonuclease subunit S [Campylobacter jejuni]HED5071502.1 restriction endonuclease subunit S [Campylobacter jejuni]HEH5814334.1 restriction endonuclease subunit S [Campylobacter jejuni]HEH5824922.1 restriction endonuclease subunit S [Campylobacter jejuni]HEH5898543.1 restriction endonuclease subunit S [Campylobacter jejuni]
MTNLPQGWEVKKLEEIANIKGGKRLPKGENLLDNNTKFAYIRVADFQDNGTINLQNIKFINENTYNVLKNYKIYDDNLYISIAGTIGKSGIIPKELNGAILTENAVKLEYIQNNISNKFMYFFTLSNIFKTQIQTSTKIVAQPKLAITRLKQIQIPLPPLKEQERIVGILDESFAKIDESIKILEQNLLNLDELMQSALQKAFNPLNDNTKENYQLPQGWEWKSLGEICYITDGTHKTPQYVENGIPFLSVKNISKGFFDLNDVKYISLEEHNKLIKRAKPEFNDILICRIGTLGKAIKVSLTFEFSIFVSLGLLKLKIPMITDYLVYFLNSCFIQIWIDSNKVGGGTHTAKLNLRVLEKCPIVIPPLSEQKQIASYLDELSLNIKNLKQNYQTQIKNLQELKKSLLDKAFKGRL